MTKSYNVIVIGAGLNGLAAAAHLAKAGKRVLVLERRNAPGGSFASEELLPGFRIDPVTDDFGYLSPELVQELNLTRHGLELLPPDASLHAPALDGRSLTLWRDTSRTLAGLAVHSKQDAVRWSPFITRMAKFAGFLKLLYDMQAPRPSGGIRDLLELATVGRKLRGLGKTDMVELLRVLPMSADELLHDEFETELLKAMIGAGGVYGIHQGIRAAGTSFVLLHHLVGAEPGAFRMRQRAKGGVAGVASAFANAAKAAGAEIRTGAQVTRIVTKNGQVTGVVVNGEEIGATRVLSSADARTTLLGLTGAAHFDPELVREVENVRFRGVIARVHLALGELPKFKDADGESSRGVISIAPNTEYIERAYDAAKYGRISENPILEVTIPSLIDPSAAPAGKHVISVNVQYAPYRLRDREWDKATCDALGDQVVRLLSDYAPNLSNSILARRVISPAELDSEYGMPEGSIDHGELGLDQILFMRPIPGWSRHRTPIQGLYLCGSGTHPGRSITGAAGKLAARAVTADSK